MCDLCLCVRCLKMNSTLGCCVLRGDVVFQLMTAVRLKLQSFNIKFKFKFKLSFIVIPLHVGTYSGMKCCASQDHGAT